MPFSRSQIAAVLARNPLPELVAKRVALKGSGKKLSGHCPFHEERTPSFFVWQTHYHCFGCGAHGDVIAWVMHLERLTFKAAFERLGGSIEDRPVVQLTKREIRLEQARVSLDEATLDPTPGFVAWLRSSYERRLALSRGWEAEPDR